MTFQNSNIKYFFVLALFLLLFIRCEDETKPFPYVYIDATFYVNTQLNDLPVGEYTFVEDYGYGGLIIYREGNRTFRAFDRACTWDIDKECVLERDEEFETLLTCPCCSSKFLITDEGRVFNGPATRRLKQYEAIYEKSSNRLIIRNY